MYLETTVNIKQELLNKLNDASISLKISRSRLIAILLGKAMKINKHSIKMFHRVKYQKSDKETCWHHLHIVLKHDVYERCLDTRKLRKMSVSFILDCAIEELLDEIIRSFIGNGKLSDNYGSFYAIISDFVEGICYFTIYHGLPPNTDIKPIR